MKIELIAGVEGQSLYLDDHRIAGPKPRGGGKVLRSWEVDLKEIEEIVKRPRPSEETK